MDDGAPGDDGDGGDGGADDGGDGDGSGGDGGGDSGGADGGDGGEEGGGDSGEDDGGDDGADGGSDTGGDADPYWPPYLATSFWNTPIPDDPPVRSDSHSLVGGISGELSSDVTQNSYPIYVVDESTETADVTIDNYFSGFDNFEQNPDGDRVGAGYNPVLSDVPIPSGAMAGGGSDDQVLFWNPQTGEEWAFWQFEPRGGDYGATNGYLYNSLLGTGRTEGSGRGAGVSKLGGLVSAEEAEVEHEVEHAIALALPSPSRQWVYPATKSDGGGSPGSSIPEGARIQLDPSLTDGDLEAMGLDATARAMARACQRYGLILVDGSGRPKAFLESDLTGNWADAGEMEYSLAPLTPGGDWRVHWRVIDWDQWTGGPTGVLGG